MAFNYADIAATATELLTEFGQIVTRRVISNGEYDTTTGTATSTTADVSRIGVAFPVKAGISTLRGNLVQSGDIELYLDPDGACEISDRYILEARDSGSWFNFFYGDVAAQQFVVVSYERMAPAGVTVYYRLHLRAA